MFLQTDRPHLALSTLFDYLFVADEQNLRFWVVNEYFESCAAYIACNESSVVLINVSLPRLTRLLLSEHKPSCCARID